MSASARSRWPADPSRWPDVASVPNRSWRGALAEIVVQQSVSRLPLRIELGNAETWGAGSLSDPVIVVGDRTAFFERLGRSGLIGFGESYMAQEWTTDGSEALTAALTVLAANIDTLFPRRWESLRRFALPQFRPEKRDPLEASREDIAAHYDLSNDMFATFLDSTMTYSSALFADPDTADWCALAAAQHSKIDRLLDRLGVDSSTRLLEIGTGWGSLAIRAAKRGARVTTLTLSAQQAEMAARRIQEAGLADRVEVRLQDYREAAGSYDAIASVEMIEAVGYDQWPTYFQSLERLLAPGGSVGLQFISMPHHRMEQTRNTYGWIHKYIFPGGLLPSTKSVADNVADHTSLVVTDRFAFGAHYAATLRLWNEQFSAGRDRLESMGFDETFYRMWQFYLCYTRAGFESGYLDVHQFVMTRATSVR